MSDRDWRERNAFVALGALLGGSILFAVVLSLWSGYPLYEQIPEPDSSAAQYAENQPGPVEGHWWPEVAARDTYAQWAMTVLAGGALIVSFVGLKWIRQTLQATRDGNEIARLSNERQLRAYVTVKNVKVKRWRAGGPIEIEIILINTGQTPARNLRCCWGAIPARHPGAIRFFAREMALEPSTVDVGSQAEYTLPLAGLRLTEDFIRETRDGNLALVVAGYGSYRDVFKKRHLLVFRGHVGFDSEGRPAGLIPYHKHNRGD